MDAGPSNAYSLEHSLRLFRNFTDLVTIFDWVHKGELMELDTPSCSSFD